LYFAGFSIPEVYKKTGKRWGSFQAFIEPVLGRKNLQIYRYSTAVKAICSTRQQTALSLRFQNYNEFPFVLGRNG
jgi:hypothetical protein